MAGILITGGTGTLGSKLSALLIQHNITHTIGSRSSGPGRAKMDLIHNTGISEAVQGKDIIL